MEGQIYTVALKNYRVTKRYVKIDNGQLVESDDRVTWTAAPLKEE